MLLIYPIAIPFTLAVHLANQLRDYDEDASQGMKGLVQYLGKQAAGRLCVGLLLLSPLSLLTTVQGYRDGAVVLLLSILVHWLLIAYCLYRYPVQYDRQTWNAIFKRLQLSGPLMLVGWALSIST